MSTCETTHGAVGPPKTTKDTVLEAGAAVTQNFAPVKAICAHLNAFHVYASDTTRCVEANHYCTHLSADVRQCLIYDAPTNPARLIGVEYMIPHSLYITLDASERALWHSHDFEVKSGMLIMPNSSVPAAAWNIAETEEMKEIVGLYGKTYHFWQVDRGDKLPLGGPELMMSFTQMEQVERVAGDRVKERDERFGVSMEEKKELRKGIEGPSVHQDADGCWK